MKLRKLKPLDIVVTKFETRAVVAEVNTRGAASLVLPQGSEQKIAWYEREELQLVGSVDLKRHEVIMKNGMPNWSTDLEQLMGIK